EENGEPPRSFVSVRHGCACGEPALVPPVARAQSTKEVRIHRIAAQIMHQARRDICRAERLRIADDEGGCVEALRDCVALMFAQGEVRPVRSLPAGPPRPREDGFVAVRRTAPAPRRSVIVDEAAAGGVLLPPTAGEELV